MLKSRWCLLLFLATSLAQGAKLPKDLKWETNQDLPIIASDKAVKGGTFYREMSTYPLTFRYVGPDSNTVLYMAILANKWGLVEFHPNTKKPIPLLATHWAFDKNGRTVYYKLDPKARWSDGEAITSEDFTFILEFYRSKNINAPWYNTYYTEQLESIVAYDDHTIAVTLPKAKPDILYHTGVSPIPRHFYGGKIASDFTMKYNWKVEPNSGPYIIDKKKVKRGKSVTWVRKKNWWAKDRPYFKNRFNVDRVVYKVVREQAVIWERFKQHKLDAFDMTNPLYWHERSKIDIFKKGYVHKLWFYNNRPQSCFGIWMNTQAPIFKDKKFREAVSYATNMDKVIKSILRGEQERMNSCTHGYGKYTNSAIVARPFDLMIQAGYTEIDSDGIRKNKQGQRAEFKMLYAYDGHKDKLVVIVEEMKKAGINMVLDLKDWSAMIKQKNSNKHQSVYSGFGAREFGVPTFWGLFHGDNANKPNTNNNANINEPQLSKDIDDYRNGTNEADRIRLSHKIQQQIHDSAIFVPAFVRPWFRLAYWRWWKFPEVPATKISASPFSTFDPARGGLFWLDKAAKRETLKAMDDDKTFPEVNIVNEVFRQTPKKKAETKPPFIRSQM